ncbi:hypothetical protein B0H14DRAFT_1069682 [Mycena olivaceomarginata]|nr:hypothetical protein B0H14DRAFT_1069682 [Mycena olivaceomarginata]
MQISGMSSSARPTVFLGADFAQYDAKFGVQSPLRLVSRRTHALGSGSFGGAGCNELSNSCTSPIPPCHVPPQTLRPSLARHAPAAAFATVHQSRPLRVPNRYPANRTTHFSSPPSLWCLCLSARVSVPATGNATLLSPIFHVPQPSRRPLISPAYVAHARASLRPSVHKGVFEASENARTSPPRRRGEAWPLGEEGWREGGGRDG